MFFSPSTRRSLSGISFGLGTVWGVAGVFKLLFGVRMTFPLLPPIDLERVAPGPSLVVAAGFVLLGAWLARSARTNEIIRNDDVSRPDETARLDAAPAPPVDGTPRRADRIPVRRQGD